LWSPQIIRSAFFLIGPVVGVIVLLAAVAVGILAFVTAIRRAEVPPD
jgi:TctA family transporter